MDNSLEILRKFTNLPVLRYLGVYNALYTWSAFLLIKSTDYDTNILKSLELDCPGDSNTDMLLLSCCMCM